jgi:hypothetical protein
VQRQGFETILAGGGTPILHCDDRATLPPRPSPFLLSISFNFIVPEEYARDRRRVKGMSNNEQQHARRGKGEGGHC